MLLHKEAMINTRLVLDSDPHCIGISVNMLSLSPLWKGLTECFTWKSQYPDCPWDGASWKRRQCYQRSNAICSLHHQKNCRSSYKHWDLAEQTRYPCHLSCPVKQWFEQLRPQEFSQPKMGKALPGPPPPRDAHEHLSHANFNTPNFWCSNWAEIHQALLSVFSCSRRFDVSSSSLWQI